MGSTLVRFILGRIIGENWIQYVSTDNIAPPIAACLGDLVTLLLLGIVSTILIPFLNGLAPILVVVVLLASSSFCLAATYRNLHVKDLLKQGWAPLFGAMIISSTTGIVLDLFVSRYEGFALLAVVISGERNPFSFRRMSST